MQLQRDKSRLHYLAKTSPEIFLACILNTFLVGKLCMRTTFCSFQNLYKNELKWCIKWHYFWLDIFCQGICSSRLTNLFSHVMFPTSHVLPNERNYLFFYFSPDLGTISSCFTDHMLVQVDLTQNPNLVASEMHLNDINCKATDTNATFASFEIPLSGCGTIRDGSDPDFLFFSNTVRWSPQQPPGQLQTRIYGFRSGITCRYARNGTVSVSIEPVQEITVSQTGIF